jgi:hypothetical protein
MARPVADGPRPQHLAYDAWWHLGHDTMVTSEWGTPDWLQRLLFPSESMRSCSPRGSTGS